jgi:hypothetical protein
MALPIIGTPVYDTALISTGTTIRYRPFLVKEEKILLMALESKKERETIAALRTIIGNCVQTPGFDVDSLPLFDIEWLFLQLRSKSVGNVVEPVVKLDCGAEVKTEINLDQIQPTRTPGHSTNIVIFEDATRKIGVSMKYPKLDLAVKLSGRGKGGLDKDPLLAFEVVRNCIQSIYENEQLHSAEDVGEKELDAFLEGLTQEQFMKITQFFETMPKLEHEVEVFNPCTNSKQKMVLKGLQDFFRSSSAMTAS